MCILKCRILSELIRLVQSPQSSLSVACLDQFRAIGDGELKWVFIDNVEETDYWFIGLAK